MKKLLILSTFLSLPCLAQKPDIPNPPYSDYIVIEASSPSALQGKVNQQLLNYYEPLGGISVSYNPLIGVPYFYQALALKNGTTH